MKQQADRHRRAVDISVGSYVWLSTSHLKLPVSLSRKLAQKFVGPFRVVAAIGPVAFRLELPAEWRIHDVFHSS